MASAAAAIESYSVRRFVSKSKTAIFWKGFPDPSGFSFPNLGFFIPKRSTAFWELDIFCKVSCECLCPKLEAADFKILYSGFKRSI